MLRLALRQIRSVLAEYQLFATFWNEDCQRVSLNSTRRASERMVDRNGKEFRPGGSATTCRNTAYLAGAAKADCDILVSQMKRIRPFLGIAIGLIALANIALNPRFQVLRTVDKLALTGCGMCIGVALVTVFALVSRRGYRNE